MTEIQIKTKHGYICIDKQAVEFYSWSGWLESVKNNKLIRDSDKNSVPYTASLLLLAGF